ncbi:MAG: hypothetical protein HY907_15620, partial [Deltaproteobacteria bacterium]|nr:hypothetical protein [Deltaproteobacteria bacterium]
QAPAPSPYPAPAPAPGGFPPPAPAPSYGGVPAPAPAPTPAAFGAQAAGAYGVPTSAPTPGAFGAQAAGAFGVPTSTPSPAAFGAPMPGGFPGGAPSPEGAVQGMMPQMAPPGGAPSPEGYGFAPAPGMPSMDQPGMPQMGFPGAQPPPGMPGPGGMPGFAPPGGQPYPGAGMPMPGAAPGGGGSKLWLFLVIGVAAAGIIGALLYFFVFAAEDEVSPCEKTCNAAIGCQKADPEYKAAKGPDRVAMDKELASFRGECMKGCKTASPQGQAAGAKCVAGKNYCETLQQCARGAWAAAPAPAGGGGGGGGAGGGGGGGCAEKMLKCMTEASAGLPPEAAAMMKESADQACESLKAGEDEAAFNKAVADCAATPCGMAGSDYSTCIMTKLME